MTLPTLAPEQLEAMSPEETLGWLKANLGEGVAAAVEQALESSEPAQLELPEPPLELPALEQALVFERARLQSLGCCPPCTDTLVEALRSWLEQHWNGVDEADRRADNDRLFGSAGAAP